MKDSFAEAVSKSGIPWWLLSGAGEAAHACKTPAGIGHERRHGFQLRMRNAEQCELPRCMFFFLMEQALSANVIEPRIE